MYSKKIKADVKKSGDHSYLVLNYLFQVSFVYIIL